MKICIIGYDGRLGSELVRSGCIPLKCDITNKDEIASAVYETMPDAIINCAAFTNVDGCESEEGYLEALKVNFRGANNIKENFSGKLIHISTDYVFDGKTGPYNEKQKYNEPVNSYGWSKYGAEVALLYPWNERTLIVRTTGLYGRSEHHDFVKLVIASLSNNEPLYVANDLRGNQTYIPHLVEALLYIINNWNKFKDTPILHVGSKEVISRYEFSLMIASIFDLNKKLLVPTHGREVSTWVARRPTKGGLKVSLAKKMGVPLYSILDGLKALKEDKNE